MSQALYRKYRPRGWAEVIGQDHIVQTLRHAIAGGRVGHAYLFAGPRGTGKTTVARLLAKAVNCLAENLDERPCNACECCRAVNEGRFLDLIEIDAASQTGVEDVRDLRDKINFAPTQGKFKVYIIDEVHMFSTSAFNALLKTLEEPPPHAIFILATTEIHKIPATVLSRCQRHEFRRVPVNQIVNQLRLIVNGEGFEAEEDALLLIARQAAGGLRDAISLLDQLASTGEKITLSLAQTVLGTATSQTVLELMEALRAAQPGAGLEAVHKALDAGADARSLARQIVDYLRGVMLFQLGNGGQVEATKDVAARMAEHAKAFTPSDVLRMLKTFNAAAVEGRGGPQPSLALELAIAEVLEGPTPEPVTPPQPQPASRRIPSPQPAAVPPPTERPAPVSETKSPPSTALPQPVSGGEIALAQVIQAWKQIGAAVKPLNSALNALLNSCKPLEIRNGTLYLGFASQVLVEKMSRPEHLELTRKAIAQILGADLTLKCVVSSGKTPPTNIDPAGMVAAALENGGEIVDIQ